jgi:hypothetical protein
VSQRRLPLIAESALRDYSASDRLAVVWRRLRMDLREPSSGAQRSAFTWAWAPALAAIFFGAGVLVGSRLVRPSPLPGLRAEPASQAARAEAPIAPSSAAHLRASVPPLKGPRAQARRGATAGPRSSESFAPSENAPYVPVPLASVTAWQHLVEQGDFAGARRTLDQEGGFDVAMAHASPSELMSLVDIARASGERGQAARALRQVLAHPDAPEAPLAAWTLGNLLEQGGDSPGAAQAFALYRRLSPTGDFAEDAAARQVDVALAEGDAELVKQLLADYARDFPHGRRLGEFRRAENALDTSDPKLNPKPEAAHDDPEDDGDEAPAVQAADPARSAPVHESP